MTVLVMTDGHEDASRERANSAVRELIGWQETEYSWDFVFLGSNINAVAVGAELGFQRAKSMKYVSTSVGRTRCACGVGFLHRGPQARARGVGEMGDKEAVRLVVIQSNDSLSCDEALRPSGPIPTQYHFDRRSGLHEISIRSVDRGLVVCAVSSSGVVARRSDHRGRARMLCRVRLRDCGEVSGGEHGVFVLAGGGEVDREAPPAGGSVEPQPQPHQYQHCLVDSGGVGTRAF